MFNDPVKTLSKYFPLRSKIYLDIETSGLEPPDAVILSIGMGAQHHYGNVPPEEDPTDYLVINILPTEKEWERASPGALKVNGMTWEYLSKHGVPLDQASIELAGWLQKHNVGNGNTFLIGQNPKFDLKFLRYYMDTYLRFVGFPYNDVVDIISLFKGIKRYDPTLRSKSYKGHDIAEALGVEPEDSVHTALGGVTAVYRNYWGCHQKITDIIEDYRQEALGGGGDRAVPLPIAESTFDGWRKKAQNMGWQELENGYIWVDKEGSRFRYVGGTPPFLIKL